jgi:K+-transporting ATPase c subunit
MPYHTAKRGKKYATVSDSGTTLGPHATKAKAQAQATAVNIAEGYVPGLKPKKKKGKA